MENLILEYTKDYDEMNTTHDKGINKRVTHELLKCLTNSHSSAKRLLRERKIKRYLTRLRLSDFHEDLLNSKFVFKDVKKYMVNYYTHKMIYSFKVGHRNIEVLFYLHDYDERNVTLCGERIEKIITLLFFLSTYSNNSCSKHLKIHCCLTNFKKYLPSDMLDVLDVEHINSAVTTSCTTSGSLVIFREEEWFKVLIHELFHVMGIDFSSSYSDMYSNKLREELNVDSTLLVFETYCEFWATIINTEFYTYFVLYSLNDLDEISFEDFYNINKVNLNIETTFSLIQVNKILSHMHLNYQQLWSDKIQHKSLRNMLYKENTNVLAYYIFKTALLVNKEQICEWLYSHNTNLLNFKEIPDNIKLFCDEIIRLSKKPSTINKINYGEQVLKKILKKNLKTDLMNKVLKSSNMTLLSL